MLFNGGVFKVDAAPRATLEVLRRGSRQQRRRECWQGNHDLDYAVARGAAYYGAAKRGSGVRIRGGTARIVLRRHRNGGPGHSRRAPRPLRALCVVPFGMEEGTETEVPGDEIGLVVGEPAAFRFFSAAARKHDKPGDMLRKWSEEELDETDSLEADLPAGECRGGLRAGAVPLQDHRAGHVRALVRQHDQRPALEAGIQRARRGVRIGRSISVAFRSAKVALIFAERKATNREVIPRPILRGKMGSDD